MSEAVGTFAPERNVLRLRHAIDAWNRRDLEAHRQLYHPAVVFHHPDGDTTLDAVCVAYRDLFLSVPDVWCELSDTLAAGNLVSTRFTLHSIGGYTCRGLSHLRFAGDRCVERWTAVHR